MKLIKYIIECSNGYTFPVYASNIDEAHAEAHTIFDHEHPEGYDDIQFSITKEKSNDRFY